MQISFEIKSLTDQIQSSLSTFTEHLDINQLLEDLRTATIFWIEQLVVSSVQHQFRNPDFLASLKMIAAKSGFRYHGLKQIGRASCRERV